MTDVPTDTIVAVLGETGPREATGGSVSGADKAATPTCSSSWPDHSPGDVREATDLVQAQASTMPAIRVGDV